MLGSFVKVFLMEVETMINNDENAQYIKNHTDLMRILKYLKRYNNGRIFDDVFADLSKHIPNLTMAYVLSLIEILNNEKHITCSLRDGIHYYNISETGIEFLSVEKNKKGNQER